MMMKKILSGLVVASVVIASCIKTDNKCSYTDSNAVAPASEIDSLQKVLLDSGITATKDPSGFFYTINQQGSGAAVTNLCSNVSVIYKGLLFNGHVFDSTRVDTTVTPHQDLPVTFQLGQVIVGWQKALPKINKDGDITLYIPPSLGYGPNPATDNSGNVIIPGNSYLIFKIHVVDIQ